MEPCPNKEEYDGVDLNLGSLDSIPDGCLPKCRYKNILPPDGTRVRLEPLAGLYGDEMVASTFINASYIRGHGGEVRYIATQGPKDNTIDAFWRMVWQEKSSLIVMLTGFF